MDAKTLINKLINEESEYLSKCEVGSDEYNASQKRLIALEDKLADLEKVESDKKDKLINYILEGIKIGSGIVLPVVGLVWITASEKEISFTGALKEYTRMFIPKK